MEIGGGAPWSCGHIRLLMAPRDGGSNPRGGKMKKKLNKVALNTNILA